LSIFTARIEHGGRGIVHDRHAAFFFLLVVYFLFSEVV